MADEPVGEGVWLPIPDVARRLGVTPQAVRGRIERGTLESRVETRGNRRKTLVRLPNDLPASAPDAVPKAVQEGIAERDDTVATLREQVARLEERLAAEAALKEVFQARVAELRAEVQEERRRREEMERRQAERDRIVDDVLRQLGAPRERQPWPGLRAWWRRFLYGEGGG